MWPFEKSLKKDLVALHGGGASGTHAAAYKYNTRRRRNNTYSWNLASDGLADIYLVATEAL